MNHKNKQVLFSIIIAVLMFSITMTGALARNENLTVEHTVAMAQYAGSGTGSWAYNISLLNSGFNYTIYNVSLKAINATKFYIIDYENNNLVLYETINYTNLSTTERIFFFRQGTTIVPKKSYLFAADAIGSSFGRYWSVADTTHPLQTSTLNFSNALSTDPYTPVNGSLKSAWTNISGRAAGIYKIGMMNGTGTVPQNFTVTVFDIDNSAPVTNFSINIAGVDYITSTGSITTNILSNDSNLYNITIFNANNSYGAFFNKTYMNLNVNTSLSTATMSQTQVRFNATTKVTTESVTGNISRSGTYKGRTDYTYNWTAGSYNVTFSNSSGWYNKTTEITIPALYNGTLNLTGIFNSILNVSANNTYSNDNLTGTFIVTSDIYDFSETQTGTNLQFNLTQNVNYTINASEEAHISNTTTFILTTINSSIRMMLSPIAFWVTFSNITSGTVNFLNETVSFTNITTFIKLTSFPLGKVGMVWNTNQIFEFVNEELPIKMFAYNENRYNDSTLTATRLVTVIADGDPVENALVTAEYWNNNKYQVVYGKLTNSIGQATLNLIGNTQYKISIQKTGYETGSTLYSVVSGDTDTITIALSGRTSQEYAFITSNCPGVYYANTTCYITLYCNTPSCINTIDIVTTYPNGTNTTDSTSQVTTTGYTVQVNLNTQTTRIRVRTYATGRLIGLLDIRKVSKRQDFPKTLNLDANGKVLFAIIFLLVSIGLGAAAEMNVMKGSGVVVTATLLTLLGFGTDIWYVGAAGILIFVLYMAPKAYKAITDRG